jgi:uncharacterized Zn finger protein
MSARRCPACGEEMTREVVSERDKHGNPRPGVFCWDCTNCGVVVMGGPTSLKAVS